uniref:DC1 domain-containing protein n=1 Tax=Quercus lobata TaxID=97700 RepID=A0A7N2L4Q8_QUELO
MELQHFSDDHPLIFSAVTASGFTCDGCNESIKSSRYSCRKCDFDLHPSCAELPRELQHPIHSKHPLILHKTPPYDGKTCTCSVCNLPCKWFVYNCTHCKFNLDIKCASLRFIPGAETHDHPLTHFRKLISFTCDFCGKEGMGMPYLCGICGFWVHCTCASLPRMLKHIRHKHPLNLTYSLKDNYSKHRLCQVCVKKVDTNYGVYYCSSCDYVAHLDCATDENGIDENFMQESKGEEPTELSYSQKNQGVVILAMI